ncbi:hypothetical protein ACJX0J_031881, partial [Zea mays]
YTSLIIFTDFIHSFGKRTSSLLKASDQVAGLELDWAKGATALHQANTKLAGAAFVSFSHLLIQEKMLKMNNVTALPKFSILFSFSNFLRSIILDSYFDFYLVLLGTTSFFLMFVFLILDHDEDIVFPKKVI